MKIRCRQSGLGITRWKNIEIDSNIKKEIGKISQPILSDEILFLHVKLKEIRKANAHIEHQRHVELELLLL